MCILLFLFCLSRAIYPARRIREMMIQPSHIQYHPSHAPTPQAHVRIRRSFQLGFPSDGPPLLNNSGQAWQDWLDQLALVNHSIPRLTTDTAKSCPCKLKELYEYISLEECGFTADEAPDLLQDFRFVRTAMVLGRAIWLWKFATPDGEPRILTVTFIDQGVMAVETPSPSLNDDQLILMAFFRSLGDEVLMRDGSSWRIAHKDEAAKDRASKWGTRPDAIPDAGLPDIVTLRRACTEFMGRDDSPYNLAFSQIHHAVPRLPQDTAETAPYTLEKIRDLVAYFNRDIVNETPEQRQLIAAQYKSGELPAELEFVRTGHVMDLLVWIWKYRRESGATSWIVVVQQKDKFTIHEGRAHALLSPDQLCLLYFAHTLANQQKHLVRVDNHWEVHPLIALT